MGLDHRPQQHLLCFSVDQHKEPISGHPFSPILSAMIDVDGQLDTPYSHLRRSLCCLN